MPIPTVGHGPNLFTLISHKRPQSIQSILEATADYCYSRNQRKKQSNRISLF